MGNLTGVFLRILPFLFILSSCSLFRAADPCRLILPVFNPVDWIDPAAGSGAPLSWRVSWLDGDGDVRSLRIGDSGCPVLLIRRESPVVVAVKPILDGVGFDIHPAGFVAGVGESRKKLNPEWADGFAADYLLDLARSGLSPVSLNVERFRCTVRERSRGLPWFLDHHRLSSDLVEGKLWVYSFSLAECHEVQLPLDSGEWRSAYVPDPPLPVGESGLPVDLPAGTHHYLRREDGLVVSVTVDRDGRIAVIGSNR